MKLGVYYEERDGELLPTWLLLPIQKEQECYTYHLMAPFERVDDFHDSLSTITVPMSALTRGPFDHCDICIHLPTLKQELFLLGYNLNSLSEADYFLLQMADIEELLQFEVARIYK